MKKISAFALATIMALSCMGCAAGSGTSGQGGQAAGVLGGAEELHFAGDYSEIYEALNRPWTSDGKGNLSMSTGVTMDAVAVGESMEVPPSAPSMDSGAGASDDYSHTNTQVDGIDEGDIVKTDGRYIFALRDGALVIIKPDGAASAVLSTTQISEDSGNTGIYGYKEYDIAPANDFYSSKYPSELYISGDTVAVLSSKSQWGIAPDSDGTYTDESYTCVDLYDISDPTAPVCTASLGQDGYTIGSRMNAQTLYLVTSYYVFNMDQSDERTYVPCVYDGGISRPMAADSICIGTGGSSTGYIVVASYDLQQAAMTATQSVLGAGEELYMNQNSIYVAGSTYDEQRSEPRQESVYTVTDYRNAMKTDLYRFSLAEGLSLSACGSVSGDFDNQFSMDEYDGMLRIVTTDSSYSYSVYTDEKYDFENYRWNDDQKTTNGLYVLDSALNIVGSVTDLAEGEQVYSVRFDGQTAYFCTYRNVDPLFAVNLTDPTAPKVMSALKISGFSEYLHPWSEGKLFGAGLEADEETGITDNVKLVMFDTSDPYDVKAAATLLTDCSYSYALYEHKAFLIDAQRNLICFPGDSGFYVFGYDESGFTQQGYFSLGDWAYNARGLYIGDLLYIVGEQSMSVVDLNDFSVIAEFT